MRASIHANNSRHQQKFATAIKVGLERHGVKVTRAPFDTPHTGVDFAVVWGGRQRNVMAAGRPYLLMERGHIGCPAVMQTHSASYNAEDLPWISLGWDGLGGRAHIPECQDDGERWERHHGHLMQPWRCGAAGNALIMGQVSGDASVSHIDFRDWRKQIALVLSADGYRVFYRPHPISLARGDRSHPPYAPLTPHGASLQDDLASACLVATYNSGAAVDAVLAGVSTIAQDRGSMAWDVTSHRLDEHLIMPDRDPWAHRLAWCQWTVEELERGDFWPVYCPMISRA